LSLAEPLEEAFHLRRGGSFFLQPAFSVKRGHKLPQTIELVEVINSKEQIGYTRPIKGKLIETERIDLVNALWNLRSSVGYDS
jgi:hypothetical protein